MGSGDLAVPVALRTGADMIYGDPGGQLLESGRGYLSLRLGTPRRQPVENTPQGSREGPGAAPSSWSGPLKTGGERLAVYGP